MDQELDRRLSLVRTEVAQRLSSMYKSWAVVGDTVVGPGTLAVRVEDQHRVGPTHFDIGFVLNRDLGDVPVLWDCAAGIGQTETEIIRRAVDTWARSTVPTVLELGTRDGSFASHFSENDPDGCSGWHVIHGPVLAFGRGSAPDSLQSWALNASLLPTLGPLLVPSFERPTLNGVKILFGFGDGEIVEVRVNGVVNEAVGLRLKSMDWPRAADAAFARCYWLFVHGPE
jgi:hypothetical protein